MTQLNSVVLPEPFGPIRLTSSPASTVRSTASTAVTPRNRLVSPRISRSGIATTRGARRRRMAAQALRPADDDDEQQEPVDHHAPGRRHPEHLGQRSERRRPDEDAAQAPHAAQEHHHEQVDGEAHRELARAQHADVGDVEGADAAGQRAADDEGEHPVLERVDGAASRERLVVAHGVEGAAQPKGREAVIEQRRPGPPRRGPSSRTRAAWRSRSGPSAGLGMPVTQSGPRVKSTQLVATIWVTTAKPRVPMAKLCSVSRNIGTPMASAARPGHRDGGGQRGRERPARLGGEAAPRCRRRCRRRPGARATGCPRGRPPGRS